MSRIFVVQSLMESNIRNPITVSSSTMFNRLSHLYLYSLIVGVNYMKYIRAKCILEDGSYS